MEKISGRYFTPASTPDNPHITETLERKSRFLAHSCQCASVEEARAFIAAIRRANFSATHNCWAFTALPPGRSGLSGSSDDGEPHGTAGRPMLQALMGSGVGEACVVVSRWFGGVKLGTGGLARAYGQAVRNNLETLPKREKVPAESLEIIAPYACVSSLKNFFREMGVSIAGEQYGEQAVFLIGLPLDRKNGFMETVAALSGGQARILSRN